MSRRSEQWHPYGKERSSARPIQSEKVQLSLERIVLQLDRLTDGQLRLEDLTLQVLEHLQEEEEEEDGEPVRSDELSLEERKLLSRASQAAVTIQ